MDFASGRPAIRGPPNLSSVRSPLTTEGIQSCARYQQLRGLPRQLASWIAQSARLIFWPQASAIPQSSANVVTAPAPIGPPHRGPGWIEGLSWVIIAWLAEMKGGSAAVSEPFTQCHCFADILTTLEHMSTATFIGVAVLTLIMLSSTVALVVLIILLLMGKLR
jgi:hypothetical protein